MRTSILSTLINPNMYLLNHKTIFDDVINDDAIIMTSWVFPLGFSQNDDVMENSIGI